LCYFMPFDRRTTMSASAIILIAIAVLVSLLLALVGSILFYSLVRREQRSQRGIFFGSNANGGGGSDYCLHSVVRERNCFLRSFQLVQVRASTRRRPAMKAKKPTKSKLGVWAVRHLRQWLRWADPRNRLVGRPWN